MADRLNGTVALVTGASSGIGEATAVELASLGAAVAVVARRGDKLKELGERIRAAGGTCLEIEADVTDREQMQAAVDRTVAELGRLDTFFANAGVMLLGPIVDADVTEWERMLDLNVKGLMYGTNAALPHLLAAAQTGPRNVADLVMTSSVAGRTVRVGSGVYNASKHAVGAFAEALRQEVTKQHVRVSLVEPGAVATELASHNNATVQASMAKRFGEMERMESEDIAEIVSFIVTRPRRVAVNEVLVRPTEQDG